MLSLIKPLNWCFPAIYSLPENCLEMLSSPMPIICGLNCSADYAKHHIISEHAPVTSKDIIYAFIDEDYLMVSKETVKSTKLPLFGQLFKEISGQFGHLFKGEGQSHSHKSIVLDLENQQFRHKSHYTLLSHRGNKPPLRTMASRELRSLPTNDDVWSLLTLLRKTIVEKLVDSLPVNFEDLAKLKSISDLSSE